MSAGNKKMIKTFGYQFTIKVNINCYKYKLHDLVIQCDSTVCVIITASVQYIHQLTKQYDLLQTIMNICQAALNMIIHILWHNQCRLLDTDYYWMI